MRSLRFMLFLALLLSSNALGGALYAVKQTDVDTILVRIDPESLVLTEIGPLRTGLSNGGLAWDPSSQTLYMLSGTNRAELFTVDLSTGEASSVAPVFQPRLTGIAYDCIRDLIYAVDWDGGLSHIDPATGFLVGGSGGSDPAGDHGFNGLVYNPFQDVLVGIRDDHPWDATGEIQGDLYSIEWHIGGGKTLLYDNPQAGFSANGLAFDPEHDLYWSVNQLGELYSFDPAANFQHTLRGSGYGELLALAYAHDAPCIRPPGPEAYADTFIESNVANAWMGTSVAGAGDVNGDGFDDVIVASRHLPGITHEEGAFVHHGSLSGIATGFSTQLVIPPSGLEFCVAGAGDVNGDGFDDVLVCSPGYSGAESRAGAVLVFHGSPSGIDPAVATQLSGNGEWAEFGRSAAGAGDVNGDGYDDIIVGSRKLPENGAQGAAFVFHGSSGGIVPEVQTRLESFQDWAEMGYSVAGAGDVNGDGYDDVIVGAPLFDDESLRNNGAAFVFHGSAGGVLPDIAGRLETDHAGTNLGFSVSGAGDVDGDGYDDVVVGAPRHDDGENRRGGAFVYHGSDGGVSPAVASRLEGDQDNAQLGYSVAAAGDVNGDGFDDLIVGARLYDLLKTNEGVAYIHLGSAGGVGTVGRRLAVNQGRGVNFGTSVAGAGDVNGDSLGDVIVGAPGLTDPEEDEGGAFVFHSGLMRSDTEINAGHAGAWFWPTTSGQGQFIDVEPESQFMFIGWFTYTGADSEHPHQQHWYTAQGNYSGNTALLDLHETLGGRFGDPQQVSTNKVGTVLLDFDDCESGSMSYQFDDGGPVGGFPLQRVLPGSENWCASLGQSSPRSVDINHGMDGSWYDPNTPGQGFYFDVHTDSLGQRFMFVSWFTYGDDSASGQRWLTAQGNFEGSTAALDLHETTGGSFDDPQAVETVKVGTLTIEFADCETAVLSYALDDGPQGAIDITRVVPGGESVCEEWVGLE